MLIPRVVFHQYYDEIGGYKPNDLASHVDDWSGVESHLADFTKSLHCADTLNYLNILRYLVQQLLDSYFPVCLWHMVPE